MCYWEGKHVRKVESAVEMVQDDNGQLLKKSNDLRKRRMWYSILNKFKMVVSTTGVITSC